ncbi:MAG: M28 family metallopeptidase [Sediminibacterium sp.]|nr:M28 family metallopeptidase [Sediminibacterium sp.]
MVIICLIFLKIQAQIKNEKSLKQIEKKFDSNLSAKRIGETIKELAAFPHHVGSEGGKRVANLILQKFKEYGWDAKIESYKVLFPTPITRLLEMNSPKKFTASLKEPAIPEDNYSNQPDQLPTFNCWSADGDVTAGLIFVNYGLPADYEILAKYGIDVKGKIVIAKYGRSWRGIKPKIAQEHGAVGCIIYSDPADDGYTAGDVYPTGAFKNENGVQRGSIMDMVVYPGDPLTPNIAATENAVRLDRKDATNLLKIPVLPIGYKDALPLLENIGGKVTPKDWAGTLPITYHFGDGNTQVHLKLNFDWKLRQANDVIATIKGSEYPEQLVIRGNHHDAWVNGADDPISSMAVELDEAYSIGQLLKTGWKPKRTLVYCAWDAEEPGLMGSTEWVEDHIEMLQNNAVAYINTDGNGRGFLGVDGSPSLENLITDISKEVIDPQTNVSVFERAKARQIKEATTLLAAQTIVNNKTFEIGAMGSGSDYSPFIQHAGVPALNIGFGGEDNGGEYHSIYDSYDNYVRFKDPSFEYGVALGKTAGRAVLRLANDNILPFNLMNFHKKINKYLVEIMDLLKQAKDKAQLNNLLVQQKTNELANNPTLKLVYHKNKENMVPYLNFSPIQNALDELEKTLTEFNKNKENIAAEKLWAYNTKLYKAEQQLLNINGLPKRTWYKHLIYAPGFYTGYGVKTLPGVREAIEQKDWKEAQEQIEELTKVIVQLSNFIAK